MPKMGGGHEFGQTEWPPIQTGDAWMAATALVLAVPLVTHNPSDYEGVDGLTVISMVRQK